VARKRMIDPSVWADDGFGRLSSDAQVMFIGLFSNADDEGRLPGDPKYLASTIFPYRGMTTLKAQKILDEIEEKMRSVTFYRVRSQPLIQFKKFLVYQKINRPTPSKYPQPQNDTQTHGALTEKSLKTHGGLTSNRTEENKKKEISTSRKEPTPYGDKSFEDAAWEAANEATANLNERGRK